MVVVMHLKLFADCPKQVESKMYILAVQLQQLALSDNSLLSINRHNHNHIFGLRAKQKFNGVNELTHCSLPPSHTH